MAKQTTIEVKRKEAREEILAMKEKIPTAILFNFFGRSFKNQSLGYWLSNIIVLNLIPFAPWILIGMLLGELVPNRYLWIPGIMAIEFFVFGLLLVHIVTVYIFDDIADKIIEKINNIQDVVKHTQWIKKSWSNPIMLRFVFIVEIIWAVLSIVVVSFVYRNFIGIGFSLTAIIMGFIVGMDFYVIYWISWLAFTLRNYQYELNTFFPADSEIISDISGILTTRVYILAAFIATATVIVSTTISEKELMNIFTLPIMLFTWATIITQFLIIRSTLVTIINKAKWKTLNKIQLKINSIESKGDLSNKETAEKLLRLADIHKRIMASETRIFDLKSVSTLFSQLMLPLLGLLLGNIDQIIALFQ